MNNLSIFNAKHLLCKTCTFYKFYVCKIFGPYFDTLKFFLHRKATQFHPTSSFQERESAMFKDSNVHF